MSAVEIREWLGRDYNFVVMNWLRSYRGSYFAGPIADHRFYQTYQREVEDLVGLRAYVCPSCGEPQDSARVFDGGCPKCKLPVGPRVVQESTREGVVVHMAVAPNKPPEVELMGFCVSEPKARDTPVLHYVFVLDDYRKNGVGKFLLTKAGFNEYGAFRYTYKHQRSAGWLRRHFSGGKFDPKPCQRRRHKRAPVRKNGSQPASRS